MHLFYRSFLPVLYLVGFVFFHAFIHAQNEYLQYRSETNPYYWKNRKPHSAYWQQDVHYTIEASLNDSSDILQGQEEILYFNNSPFELTVLYFHLYNKAYTPGSYLTQLQSNQSQTLRFGKYRKKGLGTEVTSVSQLNQPLKTELDNTILKVYLKQPLKPGASVNLSLSFNTYFDREVVQNRMKMFQNGPNKHYDIVHWYPRLAVFDAQRLWNTDQHLNHEFYGDFGSFHIKLWLPNHFICEGTGDLINANQALPDSLRRRIDLKQFANRNPSDPVSQPIKPNGQQKLWEFSAINVHDVAFSADPSYRMDEIKFKNTRCVVLVQEKNAPGWQNSVGFLYRLIESLDQNLGPYPYSKLIVADAQDGMEYPMLSLCGGLDPENRSLIIHECIHNWFQGMIGTNETYRAWMDEGFTQFFTSEIMEELEGRYLYPNTSKNSWIQSLSDPERVVDHFLYTPYYTQAIKREEPLVLNTHSDDFNSTTTPEVAYSQTYFKTGVMLKNLEYVLGRPMLRQVLREYIKRWSFCHPYPEDFKSCVTHASGQDLNWFFDAWLDSPKFIDYSIHSVKKLKKDSTQIIIKRKGPMQMPIDLAIIDAEDSVNFYYIPNTWNQKPTDAHTAQRWIGWGTQLMPHYTLTVKSDQKIKNVIIDPSYRLADHYLPDNQWKHRILWELDLPVKKPLQWRHYVIRTRPALAYNGFDGLKPGIHMQGDYLQTYHAWEATFWISSGLFQNTSTLIQKNKNSYMPLSYQIRYQTALFPRLSKSYLTLEARQVEGLDLGRIGFEHRTQSDRTRFYGYLKSFWRDESRDQWYLLMPDAWTLQAFNSSFRFGFDRFYKNKTRMGQLNMELNAPAPGSINDIRSIKISFINAFHMSRWNFKSRYFAQYGTALQPATESMLYAAGANPEELMENPITRSIGYIPMSWTGYNGLTNHFQIGGGLNLRGYNGYLMPVNRNQNDQIYTYKGLSGWSVSYELESPEWFNLLHLKRLASATHFKTYLFSDFGMINQTTVQLSPLMADAGAGIALSLFRWGPFNAIKPVTLRADFPIWLSRLPFEESNYFQFRWLLGLARTF